MAPQRFIARVGPLWTRSYLGRESIVYNDKEPFSEGFRPEKILRPREALLLGSDFEILERALGVDARIFG